MKRIHFHNLFFFASFLLTTLALFFVTIHTEAQMSTRQKFLKWAYPALIKSGKLFGLNDKGLVNTAGTPPPVSVFDLPVYLNDGQVLHLETWKGKKLLLVNTASDCGYTAQYESLQQLQDRYQEQLVIIAFPANDFKEQEKGSDAEIAQFCKKNYGIRFPIAMKSTVLKQTAQNPVFQWLCDPKKNGWCSQAPQWNFSKYLLNEEGKLMAYFPSGISPLDPQVIRMIESPKNQ